MVLFEAPEDLVDSIASTSGVKEADVFGGLSDAHVASGKSHPSCPCPIYWTCETASRKLFWKWCGECCSGLES